MTRYLPDETAPEREYAIANRERIRRLYLKDKCDTCGYVTCRCEELTSPDYKDGAK